MIFQSSKSEPLKRKITKKIVKKNDNINTKNKAKYVVSHGKNRVLTGNATVFFKEKHRKFYNCIKQYKFSDRPDDNKLYIACKIKGFYVKLL